MKSSEIEGMAFNISVADEAQSGRLQWSLAPACHGESVLTEGTRKEKGSLFLFCIRCKASVNKYLIYLRNSRIITLPPKVRNSLVLGISWPSFQ